MKGMKVTVLLLGFSITAASFAGSDQDLPLTRNYQAHRPMYDEFGIGIFELVSLLSHPVISENIRNGSLSIDEPAFTPRATGPTSLSDFEVALPHKTQRIISRFERVVLTAYLNHPADIRLIKFLALYHLNAAHQWSRAPRGSAVEHAIMAAYFLNRAKDLGSRERWIAEALRTTETKLATLAASRRGVALEENHPAHAAYHDAFFTHEENRYVAYERLLDDYAAAPNNVYTTFLNMTVNLWTGGEAGFDDPTVLYNFVLGSYFSIRTIDLARQAELAWERNPTLFKRFRLASITGGLSIGHRRFLAKLHQDVDAIRLLDAEHQEWRQNVNPVFHMFTVGYMLFDEPENFVTARDAWEEGLLIGTQRPDLITILNRPRFTFNSLCIFMGSVDFALKSGEVGAARGFWLATVPFLPFFAEWDIGKDAFVQRLAHAEEIAALYLNDNPADDPVPFNVKNRKWGYNTMTCQTCHQTQRKVWSEEDKNTILLAPDDILTVGEWPAVSTTWYGAVKRRR